MRGTRCPLVLYKYFVFSLTCLSKIPLRDARHSLLAGEEPAPVRKFINTPRWAVPMMCTCTGGSRDLRKGARHFLSLPLPLPLSLPCPSVLEVGPLNKLGSLWKRCKLPQRGPGQSPGQKRIWCTLKLSESHCRQSFCIFWVPCFTYL